MSCSSAVDSFSDTVHTDNTANQTLCDRMAPLSIFFVASHEVARLGFIEGKRFLVFRLSVLDSALLVATALSDAVTRTTSR